MARKGSHDHLKSEVLVLFEQGKSPAEVCKTYPGIPRPTVYRWYESWQQKNTGKIRTNTDTPVNTGSRVSELRPKLSVLPAADDGIGWGIRKCKDIIEFTERTDPRTAVAAINAYFKGLELMRTESAPRAVADYDDAVEELEKFFNSRGVQQESAGT